VEADEAHTLQDSRADLPCHFILDPVVGHVPPPGHDIGASEHLVGQAVIGLIIQRSCTNLEAMLPQPVSEYVVYPIGVDSFDLVVGLLVDPFVPDGHPYGLIHMVVASLTAV